MARIFLDGVESGSLDLWTSSSGATAASTSGITGMTGDYCIELSSLSDNILKTLTATSELYVSLKVYSAGSITNNTIISFLSDSTTQGLLYLDTYYHSLYARKGSYTGGSPLGSGGVLYETQCKTYEIHYKLDSTTGIFKVKQDGEVIINYVGNTGVGTLNRICLGSFDLGTNAQIYVDDVVLDSDSWIGQPKIKRVYPTGIGASGNNWYSTRENDWESVDEIPYSLTDFIHVNTTSVIDTFETSDLSLGPVNFKSVQLQTRGRKGTSSSVGSIKLAIRSNSTDYPFSTGHTLLVTTSTFSKATQTDPATSAAWTSAGINAMEIGVKSET
jgi:hypothetical protein